ncbi:MAG: hypothetical protein ACOYNZ_09715 [Rhodoferax sp.]
MLLDLGIDLTVHGPALSGGVDDAPVKYGTTSVRQTPSLIARR